MKRDEFGDKLREAEELLKEEWFAVAPKDIVVGFTCLWKISEGVPPMAEVWKNVKKRLPRFAAKIEEAWPRGESSKLETGESDGTEQH
jgi:hypothetical protein